MSSGLISASTCSSSASLGWRGKAAGFVLQVLRAQQRKLRVRSFIVNVSFFFLSSSGVKMIWGWVLLFKSLLDVCKCHFKKLCVGQSEVKLTPRLYMYTKSSCTCQITVFLILMRRHYRLSVQQIQHKNRLRFETRSKTQWNRFVKHIHTA